MARKTQSPEEKRRRAKIRELLQAAEVKGSHFSKKVLALSWNL